MSRTRVDVAAAAVEWSDCGGGRGSAGIRPSNLGKGKSGGGSGNGGGSRGSDSGGGGGNSGEDNGGAVEEIDQDGSDVGGPSGSGGGSGGIEDERGASLGVEGRGSTEAEWAGLSRNQRRNWLRRGGRRGVVAVPRGESAPPPPGGK